MRRRTPEEREMPGFEGKLAKWDRHRHGRLLGGNQGKTAKTKTIFLGVDCDEVYPGIILGNGATVKKKEW